MAFNDRNSFYKTHRHLFMADVVNPNNIYKFYGKGTRVRSWLSCDNGFVRTHVLPFPPLKEGEQPSKQENEANERIYEGQKRYVKWRNRKPSYSGYKKRCEEFKIECAKHPEAEKNRMLKAKAEKDAVERKWRMMIKAKNLPSRSFHLFKNLLKKKKKIASMNG